jgi:cytoskeletal protein RodZ
MSSNNQPDSEHINARVVRTLKDPPEIWELVHPVEEKQFNPRLVFLTRLRSGAKSLILLVVGGGLALGVLTVVSRFRTVQEPSATIKTIQPVPVSRSSETANAPNSTAPPIDSSVTQPTDVSVSDNSRRAIPRLSKRKPSIAAEVQRPAIASTETPMQVSPPTAPAPKTDQQARVATDSDKQDVAGSASAKPKPTATLNPRVIAPPKSDPQKKPKVIQWP